MNVDATPNAAESAAIGGLQPESARWLLGTMGYAYPGWAGTFYPHRLGRANWLAYYAKQFPAVELNTTFHALPTADRFEKWAHEASPGFQFAVKMGRHVTHDVPLADAQPGFVSFLNAVRPLGPTLGCVLIQLPPSTTFLDWRNLQRCLAASPAEIRLAIEFRHASWRRPETRKLLEDYRAAWVAIDHDDHPQFDDLPITTDFAYLRLIGKHGRYDTDTHEVRDPTKDLEEWRNILIEKNLSQLRTVWVMFNNDYAGHAPTTLRRFAEMMKVAVTPQPPRQKSLF